MQDADHLSLVHQSSDWSDNDWEVYRRSGFTPDEWTAECRAWKSVTDHEVQEERANRQAKSFTEEKEKAHRAFLHRNRQDLEGRLLKKGFARSRLFLVQRELAERGIRVCTSPTKTCTKAASDLSHGPREIDGNFTLWQLECLVLGEESPYRKQCEHEARKLHSDPHVRDALVQVGLEALWYKALRKWNPFAARLSTFAEVVVRHAMIDYLRKEGRRQEHESLALDDELRGLADPASTLIASEGEAELVTLLRSLPSGEAFIAEVLESVPIDEDPLRAARKRYRVRERAQKLLAA